MSGPFRCREVSLREVGQYAAELRFGREILCTDALGYP